MGIFGTTWVFDVLSAHGLESLGLEILNQTSYPSLGYMVSQGATTLWEAWNGDRHNAVSSRNHIMFGGGVNRFIARAVVGLPDHQRRRQEQEQEQQAPEGDSSSSSSSLPSSHSHHFQLGPSAWAVRALGQAKGWTRVIGGIISVSWRRQPLSSSSAVDDDGLATMPLLELNVTIPVDSTATVRLPLLGGKGRHRVVQKHSGGGGSSDKEITPRSIVKSKADMNDADLALVEVGGGDSVLQVVVGELNN
eukprot:g3227.t1